MGLGGLALFMVVMWVMVLTVAAFLIVFVAPLDTTLFHGKANRIIVSIVQAAIAIIVVILLVFGLSRMKKIYLQKKLRQ